MRQDFRLGYPIFRANTIRGDSGHPGTYRAKGVSFPQALKSYENANRASSSRIKVT